MASPNNFVRIRDKDATISKIDIPKDKLEVLNTIVSSDKVSRDVKRKMLKDFCNGSCCTCEGIPTQIVTYKLENATRIERYCDKCVKSLYAREQVL